MSDGTLATLTLTSIDTDEGLSKVLGAAAEEGPVASSAEDWFGCVDRVLVCDEPVRLKGPVCLPSEWDGAAVIFAKGLEVDGFLEDSGGDDTVICVLGDLSVTHLLASVYWLVTGDVKVKGTAVGVGTLDYLMEHDGKGSADVLIESDYALGFEARVAVKAGRDRKELRGVLAPECLNEDGSLRLPGVRELLEAGRPITV